MFIVHIQTTRLLQLLCTDPSTISYTVTNLWQFCYILEMIKRLNICNLKVCHPRCVKSIIQCK